MDKLFFTESEGYNVQNGHGKYPSRFIREAQDEGGLLYDTVGRFDPSLWEGTDALIAKMDAEMNGTPRSSTKEEGQEVCHSIFGKGAVMEIDDETGIATVKFEGFGVRKVRQDILTEAK